MLCLHGLTRNCRDFEDVAERYAGRFRVLAIDFRGRGNSEHDPQPERYIPATYAGDVLKLLDELSIGRAIFLGTSLGGLVTMIIAVIQPARIAGAILNDVGPYVDERGLERIRGYVGAPLRFNDWSEAAEYFAAINGRRPDRFGPAEWKRVAERLCREENGAIVLNYDMAIAVPFQNPAQAVPVDMWPMFRQLAKRPLFIFRGEMSDLLLAETAEQMLAAGPDVELVTVEGVGHAPWLDEPEVLSALDRFLGRWER